MVSPLTDNAVAAGHCRPVMRAIVRVVTHKGLDSSMTPYNSENVEGHLEVRNIVVGAILIAMVNSPFVSRSRVGITNEGSGVGVIRIGGCNGTIKQTVTHPHCGISCILYKSRGSAVFESISNVGRYADMYHIEVFRSTNRLHQTCRIITTNRTRDMKMVDRRRASVGERGRCASLRSIDIAIDGVTIAIEETGIGTCFRAY